MKSPFKLVLKTQKWLQSVSNDFSIIYINWINRNQIFGKLRTTEAQYNAEDGQISTP